MVNFQGNIIFFIEVKRIHICNFLTIDFYKKLQEYFFVCNQFLIRINIYIFIWQLFIDPETATILAIIPQN